jgi:hypothetical protein
MARLCIRILPNPNTTEPSLNVMRTQEGDVVCIVDDGHAFSFGELNCGHYRIIDIPGVPPADLANLVESVFDADGATILRRRRFTLLITVLNSGPWKNRTTATKAQIDSITTDKT